MTGIRLRCRIMAVGVCGFLVACSGTDPVRVEDTPAVTKRDEERAERVNALISEGVALHDQGEYREALRRYNKALGLDPYNALAAYEMGLTYTRMGDFEGAHRAAQRGLQVESKTAPALYSISAAALDNLGRKEEAVRQFQEGISRYPQHYSLRLNLGITFMRLGDRPAARGTFEDAIPLEPDQPSGHLYLGELYATEYQFVPAILALSRFLVLEADTQRSQKAAKLIRRIMDEGVGELEDGTQTIAIEVDDDPSNAFERIERRMTILVAALTVAQSREEGDTTLETYALVLSGLMGLLADEDIQPDLNFASSWYVPYYRELESGGHSDAFAHVVLWLLDRRAAQSWFSAHTDDVDAFTRWSNGYVWPGS